MNTSEIVNRIDELLKKSDEVNATTDNIFVNPSMMLGWRAGCLSFLEKLLGKENAYYIGFNEHVNNNKVGNVNTGKSILNSFKDEVKSGWFFSVKKMISAEIFSDFLEMAEYLLNEGYKDAAAVMIGSVLEEHLRQLCVKHKIPLEVQNSTGKMVPKKADTLNAELLKASVYTRLELKSITAWLDIRNNAAHGKYNEYTNSHVESMYSGVADFISRINI